MYNYNFFCSLFSVLLFLNATFVNGEEMSQVFQGNCPAGWIDGSVVEMGCLHFNHTESMIMLDAAVSCQQGMTNATLIEILTSAVKSDYFISILFLLS